LKSNPSNIGFNTDWQFRWRFIASRLSRVMARTLRAAPSGLRMDIRFLSGASRRPSSGCSGRSSTRVRSRVRPPLIRSPVSNHLGQSDYESAGRPFEPDRARQ
jgi:hypothetical protein